ncbi:MAG: hypothetical protein KGO96_10420 [Elusimicrobia bacterium]|nr:hypothetical protein [Elusimicrobiota bacterium]
MRKIVEIHTYSRKDLEHLVMSCAKMQIIGGMYIGEFGSQSIEWREDGSCVVTTTHTPAEIGEWKRGQ